MQSADTQLCAELQALTQQQLLSYALLEAHDPVISQSSVTRHYTLRVQVSELQVPVAGASLRLLGFGSSARIHDFRNIVGALLANDIELLPQATKRHRWFHLQPDEELERALEIVMDSEVNEGILAGKRKRGTSNESIAREFSGAVSPEFVGRLQREFRQALWRATLVPIAAPMIGATAFMTLVSFGFSHFINSANALKSPWQAVGTAFTIAVIAASGAEWRAIKRLGKTFDGPSWGKIRPMLGRLHVTAAARGAAVIAFSVVLGVLMTSFPLR